MVTTVKKTSVADYFPYIPSWSTPLLAPSTLKTDTMLSRRDSDGDHENRVVDVAGMDTGNTLAAEVPGMCV